MALPLQSDDAQLLDIDSESSGEAFRFFLAYFLACLQQKLAVILKLMKEQTNCATYAKLNYRSLSNIPQILPYFNIE